ncbi:MAG: hypothetical protein JWP91_3937 [Fibrobacteres bacterium]|nr:hypothetical protein [Fibrobacterota bacterium]
MKRLAQGLVVLSTAVLTALSCHKDTSKGHVDQAVRAFSEFAATHPMLIRDSAIGIFNSSVHGCSENRSYMVKVPFKSEAVIGFYDSSFTAAGLSRKPGVNGRSDQWMEYRSKGDPGSSTNLLTTERTYLSGDRLVRCRVSLVYNQDKQASGPGNFAWAQELQSVLVACEPNLPAAENPCYHTKK